MSRRCKQVGEEALRVLAASNSDGPSRFYEVIDQFRQETAPAAHGACGALDWGEFWEQDHLGVEWIFPDVLARGRGHAIYAKHKMGKSLFALFMAVTLATGQAPAVCLYLDYEMGVADLRERLEAMGYGPGSDLARLHYVMWPDLPPLDTPAGGSGLMAVVDAFRAKWPEHHLVVVIDTMSRAIAGDENSADTYRAFYSNSGIQLKRRGVTWVRLDHAGHSAEHQRGSSGKGDDVDLVWKLEATDGGLRLKRDSARMSWVLEKVVFARSASPLTFRRLDDDWPSGTQNLAGMLDELNVPLSATVDEALEALRHAGPGRRRQLVAAAVRWRKERV